MPGWDIGWMPNVWMLSSLVSIIGLLVSLLVWQRSMMPFPISGRHSCSDGMWRTGSRRIAGGVSSLNMFLLRSRCLFLLVITVSFSQWMRVVGLALTTFLAPSRIFTGLIFELWTVGCTGLILTFQLSRCTLGDSGFDREDHCHPWPWDPAERSWPAVRIGEERVSFFEYTVRIGRHTIGFCS